MSNSSPPVRTDTRAENLCSPIVKAGGVANDLNGPLKIRNSAAFRQKSRPIRKIAPLSAVFKSPKTAHFPLAIA